jgi:hypothetical protein
VDDDRSSLVRRALAKGVALLVGVAAVIALGTFVMVHALGLNGGTSSAGTVIGSDDTPPSPLPSTALPVPGSTSGSSGSSSSSDPSDGASAVDGSSGSDGSTGQGTKGLRLSITPLSVSPGQRINFTGTYGKHDGVSLQVQRLENGTWADFPTNAQVSLGTFATYIETSHTGAQKFRVYDAGAGAASNVVTVTVQ